MATLVVKDIPDDVYESLRERAQANGRSIASEVRVILRMMAPPKRSLREVAESVRRLREKIAAEGRGWTNEEIVDLIREGRDEQDKEK
jgi:plasmid stability protein